MNLNDVFNLPEKQWTPKGQEVAASILSVGQQKEDQYGYKQPIVLTDITGASQELMVQSKFVDGLIRPEEKDKTMMWICKWYAGKYGKKLVGYTTTPRNTALPQTPTPQPATTPSVQSGVPSIFAPAGMPPQAPQQPLQTPNARQRVDGTPDWDAIAEGKVRNSVVCAYIQRGSEPDIGCVKYWVDYIMNGTAPTPPQQPIPDDEIPF